MKIIGQLADWMLRTERISPRQFERVKRLILGVSYATMCASADADEAAAREEEEWLESEWDLAREEWWDLHGAGVRAGRTGGPAHGGRRHVRGRRAIKVWDLAPQIPERLGPLAEVQLAGLLSAVAAVLGRTGMCDSWEAFAEGVDYLHGLDVEALHDAVRVAAMRRVADVVPPLFAAEAGRTLLPVDFLSDLSGKSVNVLKARLESDEVEFHHQKTDWILAYGTFRTLVRASRVRNRLRRIFRLWMRTAVDVVPDVARYARGAERDQPLSFRFDFGTVVHDLSLTALAEAALPSELRGQEKTMESCRSGSYSAAGAQLLEDSGYVQFGLQGCPPEGLLVLDCPADDLPLDRPNPGPQRLRIPASLQWIAAETMCPYRCPDEIAVAEGNAFFHCEDGWLLDRRDGCLLGCRAANLAGAVVVPSSVRMIPHRFFNCSGNSATSIRIPGTVRDVGMVLGASPALAEIYLEEGVETFDGHAFLRAPNLARLVLPGSLQGSGLEYLTRCRCLRSIECLSAGGRLEFRNGLLFDRRESRLLACTCDIVRADIPEGVTEIPEAFFDGRGHLEEVSCPDSLRHIRARAFRGCLRLHGVSLNEGVETLGADAFNLCFKMTSLEIPASVTGICYSTFTRCRHLSVKAPRSFEAEGARFFGDCAHVEYV